MLFVDQAEQLEAEKEDTIKRAGELRELLTKLEDEQNRMEAQKTDLIAEKDKLLSEKGKYLNYYSILEIEFLIWLCRHIHSTT